MTTIEEKEDGVTTSTKTLTYDGEFTYTWQMGRQLQGISGTNLATSYKYNENGLRTEKTANGQKHEYTHLGSNVTREVIRDAQGAILWTIHYAYAGGNSPVSMNVDGVDYYYLKNAQGDITHIVDAAGNEIASYEYDAWGNHLSVTGGEIAELNPYRYRGYRYDNETGLYYLQSRYYNPEGGRFINADALLGYPGSIHGHNLYGYCFNNPLILVDLSGYWPSLKQVLTGVAIAAVTVVVVAAVIAAAPAVAGAASATAVFYGASAVICGKVAATATFGTAVVAAGVLTTGLNRSAEAVTGKNYLADTVFRGNHLAYENVETAFAVASLGIMSIPSTSGYPSTGRTEPRNLKDQISLNAAKKNPGMGHVVDIPLGDPRMPSWMGWQKYSMTAPWASGNTTIHYVGHKFIPAYFDFKIAHPQ